MSGGGGDDKWWIVTCVMGVKNIEKIALAKWNPIWFYEVRIIQKDVMYNCSKRYPTTSAAN